MNIPEGYVLVPKWVADAIRAAAEEIEKARAESVDDARYEEHVEASRRNKEATDWWA